MLKIENRPILLWMTEEQKQQELRVHPSSSPLVGDGERGDEDAPPRFWVLTLDPSVSRWSQVSADLSSSEPKTQMS